MIPYMSFKPARIVDGKHRYRQIAATVMDEDNSITAIDFNGCEEVMAYHIVKEMTEAECKTIKAKPVLMIFANEQQRKSCLKAMKMQIPAEFYSEDYMLTENGKYAINLRLEQDIDSLNENILFDYVIVSGAAGTAGVSGVKLYRLIQLYKDTSRLIFIGNSERTAGAGKNVWTMLLNHPEVRVISSPWDVAKELFKSIDLENNTIEPKPEKFTRRHVKEYSRPQGVGETPIYYDEVTKSLSDLMRSLSL